MGVAPPAEWRQLIQSLERQNAFERSAPLAAAWADRGFCSRQGASALAQYDLSDAGGPREPQVLRVRMGEARFAGLQRRRGATEARSAILQQRQGRRLRRRGFAHRYRAVARGVLGHHLWLVARLLTDQQKIAAAA